MKIKSPLCGGVACVCVEHLPRLAVNRLVAVVLLVNVGAIPTHLDRVTLLASTAQEDSVAVILTRGGKTASADALIDSVGGWLAHGLAHGNDASGG